ncbi:hypothetical protein PFICI_10542 [Pestalotiopsis fici W106-1]|uniref:Uncharacterized protein n=1 Tax=Pestalotiopsis fici (strain W106-1 / CGMCC3.15140) TaxID=1229662 RepID=W3WXA1_PESFW|nr:uncharacterized protein PFICI_10542 [Pestalotiopsis fici W106-1]ETS78480.1 hypothetical protein PFICI_10542 [Pestalotiopsis fici W106-1]
MTGAEHATTQAYYFFQAFHEHPGRGWNHTNGRKLLSCSGPVLYHHDFLPNPVSPAIWTAFADRVNFAKDYIREIMPLLPTQVPDTNVIAPDYIPTTGDFVVLGTGRTLYQIIGFNQPEIGFTKICFETRDGRPQRLQPNILNALIRAVVLGWAPGGRDVENWGHFIIKFMEEWPPENGPVDYSSRKVVAEQAKLYLNRFQERERIHDWLSKISPGPPAAGGEETAIENNNPSCFEDLNMEEGDFGTETKKEEERHVCGPS